MHNLFQKSLLVDGFGSLLEVGVEPSPSENLKKQHKINLLWYFRGMF